MTKVVSYADWVFPVILTIIGGIITGLASIVTIVAMMPMINSLIASFPGISSDVMPLIGIILAVTCVFVVLLNPVMSVFHLCIRFALAAILVAIFGDLEKLPGKPTFSVVGYSYIPLFLSDIVSAFLSIPTAFISVGPLLSLFTGGSITANPAPVLVFGIFSLVFPVITLGVTAIFKVWSTYLVYRGVRALGVESGNASVVGIGYGIGIIVVLPLIGMG
jgi:hypothetical protein